MLPSAPAYSGTAGVLPPAGWFGVCTITGAARSRCCVGSTVPATISTVGATAIALASWTSCVGSARKASTSRRSSISVCASSRSGDSASGSDIRMLMPITAGAPRWMARTSCAR